MNNFEGINFFKPYEFDSPDLPGSSKNMHREFLVKLDKARAIADIKFKITSGYRTRAYHEVLRRKGYKTAVNSPHLSGWAADIRVNTSSERYTIIRSLQEAGFNRIGIGANFIHVDCDPSKPPFLIWTYY